MRLDRPVWSELPSIEFLRPILTLATPTALARLPLGTSAIVRRVVSGRSIARRLMELGLVPGTCVTITRVAPLGDPLELRVRNYALSIRRSEALAIEVDEMRA
jgi:ferrous iron transport protein A